MAETAKVTQGMVVAEVVARWPLAADIMESYGLTCTGCSVSATETIEAGARSHGMPDEQIQDMIKEVNDAVSSGKVQERPAPKGGEEPLQVTDKAAEKMKTILQEQKKENWGIRMFVSPGGCAGYSYGMDVVKKPVNGESVLEFRGTKVFVDSKSAKFLAGVTVDYVETLQETGFKFNNPNAKSSCGCGKSFN